MSKPPRDGLLWILLQQAKAMHSTANQIYLMDKDSVEAFEITNMTSDLRDHLSKKHGESVARINLAKELERLEMAAKIAAIEMNEKKVKA